MTQTTMIQVKDLKKDYGGNLALRGISFEVPSGEVLGFLGPNGAGKTTTMKIITCYMAPTAGSAAVGGHGRRRQPDGGEATDRLPPRGHAALHRHDNAGLPPVRRRDAPGPRHHARSPHPRPGGGLRPRAGCSAKPIGELSKGFRQRVGLSQAMIHDPPILILDEPTSGLDPNQIVEIRELIREIGKEKTVILSTHILPEVQATCGRVIIIAEGKLVADGSPQELATRDSDCSYRLLLDIGETNAAEVDSKLGEIDGVSKVTEVDGEEGSLGLMVAADTTRDLRRDLFTCVKDNGWILLEMQRQTASLEDVFRKLTRE